ncbi:MAG: flagellar motor switch protein FliN [Fidelibacterota bacterium]
MTFDSFRTGYQALLESWQETLTTALNKLFKQEFTIAVAMDEDQSIEKVVEGLEYPQVWVQFETTGKMNLTHALILPIMAAGNLFTWMTDTDAPETLEQDQLNILKEGIDQIINQLIAGQENGSIFELENLTVELVAEAPNISQFGIEPDTGYPGVLTLATPEFAMELHHLVWGLTETAADDDAEAGTGEMDSLFEEEEEEVNVHPAEFENFNNGHNPSSGNKNLDMLLDVELEVFVELGRKKMLIKDLLKLGKGSVIELDKAAGEPLEIFVNGRKLADGEVVVVDDSFGVRITQIVGNLRENSVLEQV